MAIRVQSAVILLSSSDEKCLCRRAPPFKGFTSCCSQSHVDLMMGHKKGVGAHSKQSARQPISVAVHTNACFGCSNVAVSQVFSCVESSEKKTEKNAFSSKTISGSLSLACLALRRYRTETLDSPRKTTFRFFVIFRGAHASDHGGKIRDLKSESG